MEQESEREEIEETTAEESPLISSVDNPKPGGRARSVKTKVPEVEIHLFRRGKGPIEIFKSSLGGWDQDRLEVHDILETHGFKSIFAFNPRSGRGVAIRFNPKNGRSLIPYADGSVIYIDGEPKDSIVKPITKILVGVAVLTLFIILVMKETPGWMKSSNISAKFPPWVLACIVIVFTRLRKRTRDIFKKYGW